MTESYFPLDDIEADYSSDEEDAVPFASSTVHRAPAVPSSPPNFEGHFKVKKKPPPVPPKKRGRFPSPERDYGSPPERDYGLFPTVQGHPKVKKKPSPVPPKKQGRALQQEGGFSSPERDHGLLPPGQASLQRDLGHHNPAFQDEDSAMLRDSFSGNVNSTSSDVPHDKTGPAMRGFSYLSNAAPPVFPRHRRPVESPSFPAEDFGVTNNSRSPDSAAAQASATYQSPEESGVVTDSDGDDVSQQDEDLAGLEYLDNDILLGHLRTRFDQQQPYTYLGESLVAVNPCKPLNIYTKELHEKYRHLRVRTKAPAHIFWVASQVHRNLLTTGRSQCVVVGGDSGAGKTESIKYILNHLVQSTAATTTTNTTTALGKAHSVGDGVTSSQDIVGKLEKVNPLVELFGNASTVLNENSSRFGKLVELEYDEQGTLSTARLECFILEKFRVTSRNPVEKNFHVFYALFAGLSSQRLSELGLDLSAESYRILKPWDLTDGVFRTEEELQRYSSQCALLHSILPDIGFDPDEMSSLFKMLSTILLLSNVEFEHPDPDVDDVIVLDGMGELCLERAVEVLGLEKQEAEDFENSLLRVSMEIKGEKMVRHKTLRQARDGRDALARELYAVLFYGVIDKINHNLRDGDALPSASSTRSKAIRLLDISGFENVEHHNGFEQFVINSTNERLHQFFLQRTFRHELDDYVREDVTPVDVTFRDNAQIVQLIFAKPEGLIPLLEDEIATHGSDQGWLTRCDHRSTPTPASHFTPQPSATAFILLHYAGKVKYSAEGFVEKNSDTVHHNLREVVQRSENTFIRDYFTLGSDTTATLHKSGRASFRKRKKNDPRPRDPFAANECAASKRTGKLTGRFTDQYQKSLSGMMSKLQTDTIFVSCYVSLLLHGRCIKPNVQLHPNQFQADVVRDQLLSCGLLEVIKIRRDGYPVRTKFADFLARYKDLLESVDVRRVHDEREIRRNCNIILSSAGVTGYQMGHSKVFLKMNHRDRLNAALDAKLKERQRREREERERREREERERREREERERREREERERREREERERREREERERREREERERREREERGIRQREERARAGRERGAAGVEEDSLSTSTTPSHTNTTESGFDLDRNQSKSEADTTKMDRLSEESDDLQKKQPLVDGDDDDGDRGGDEKEKQKAEKKRQGLGSQPAYNVFRLTERDFESSTDFEMKIRRGVRLLLYAFIFCLILAGGVVSRIALVWLSSAQLQTQQSEDAKIILRKISDAPSLKEYQADLGPTRLLVCHLVPFLVGWLACLGQVVFGRHVWPGFKALILVTLLDCAGVAGRSVFLYKVLPGTDFLTALVLGTAVCQVPAVFRLISHLLVGSSSSTTQHAHHPSKRRARIRHSLYLVLLVLAVLIQLGAVPLVVFSEDLISALTGASGSIRLPDLWALIVATFCSSLGWWGNYAYGKTQPHKHSSDHHVKQGLSKWRIEMDRIRRTSFVYTGPVQMMVLVGLFFGLKGEDVDVLKQIDVMFRSLGAGFGDGEAMGSHWAVYNLVYLHLAATLVTPYLSGMACRVYMQRVAFAAPVTLVAPVCMALTFACTPLDLGRWYEARGHCVTADVSEAAVTWMLVLGGLVWVSVVIVNQHVWFPEVERTAKMERLFFFPYRDPVFLDICLQCSRRQDKMENAERHRQHKKWDGKFKEGVERPTVYICATMWHEVRQEMLQLLKSLLRVDFDVYTRRKAMSQFQILEEYSDLYDPEIHIIFDDAFETESKSKQRVLNSWVRQFIEVMPEAMGSVTKRNIDMQPPIKIPTPYGGRLQWTLPGGTFMYLHLKDKDRIRHRKRWSQVMYLYYLLGYRLMADYRTVDDALNAGESKLKHRRRSRVRTNTSLLNNIAPAKVRQADNVFLMALDGDVDFRPDAVRLLLDRMKKNKKVAAVCGRIHPIGDGPMVWYQKFEYAVGHWLQKAAEHVFGCVLCCPGCFSLFRGSALMDDNVMRMYTTEPTEALHFIQYDQGEDRWLCTLLLQQGWKIEYCAGADALTFAPETFHDFYIQRRRWSPSTLANIMDLIGSWRFTVRMNDNISVLFMLYQFVLMTSSIIAPGLVVFLIAQSYNTVLSIGLEESYVLSVVPVFLYILLCLKAQTRTQINVAAVMSSVYAIIMLLVTIGTIINVASSTILAPNVLFLVALAVIFLVAGFIHPNELFCLFHGLLYYLTVPSTFVFLTVFFLCNLHVVSWGTREGPKKADPQQEGLPPVQEKRKLYTLFEKLGITAIAQDIKAFAQQIVGMREQIQLPDNNKGATQHPERSSQQPKPEEPPRRKLPPPKPKQEPVVERDDTFWTRELDIPNSTTGEIEKDEAEFWRFLLEEYLHPIKANKDRQDKISADLISARNNVVFGYMLLNLMFTLVLLQLRLQQSKLEDKFYIAGEYEPVSTLILILFSMLLLIQFCGMLSHRWGTFLHLIASTRIAWFASNEEEERALTAIQEAQKLISANAVGDIDLINPDYSDDEDDTGDDYTTTALSTDSFAVESGNALTDSAHDPEEAPDYSDSEEEEGEALSSVQYDTVFNRRFRNVRRHIEQKNRPPRTQLNEKNPAAAVSRPTFMPRHFTRYERRQSLYMTNPQDLWRGGRHSVLHI